MLVGYTLLATLWVNGTPGAAWPAPGGGGKVTGRSPGGLMSSTAATSTSSRSRARISTSSNTAPASVSVLAWKLKTTLACTFIVDSLSPQYRGTTTVTARRHERHSEIRLPSRTMAHRY